MFNVIVWSRVELVLLAKRKDTRGLLSCTLLKCTNNCSIEGKTIAGMQGQLFILFRVQGSNRKTAIVYMKHLTSSWLFLVFASPSKRSLSLQFFMKHIFTASIQPKFPRSLTFCHRYCTEMSVIIELFLSPPPL